MRKRHGPDHVTRMIRHLQRVHQHEMNRLLQQYDIYPGQPPLMFTLDREPGRSQAELARELDIKPATLTIMLNRMEKNGYVRRETDSQDQRVSRIYLTDKGQAAVGEIRESLQTLENRAMDGFSDDEVLLLKGMLARIRDNMKSRSEDEQTT
ncbi:MarR family winged helix-turn-helix transcriptional regulator [Paenibacillus sp. NPDC058071]|uniref:MarR family winged helix-turn-helix transcriptional regulator n=1 Tax=Paenibacillus sp. NPDC058071 TaxID=3346326 RepID=UPI0036DAEE0A